MLSVPIKSAASSLPSKRPEGKSGRALGGTKSMNENTTGGNQSADCDDPEWLRQKYYGEGLTTREMAGLTDVSRSTIENRMEEHGVERRSSSDRAQLWRDRNPVEVDSPHTDGGWLREKYHEEGLSAEEIGELVGRHRETIRYWMKRRGVSTRTRSENHEVRGSYKRLETGSLHYDEDWLRTQYVEKKRTMADIAEEVGVERTTIAYALDDHDIPRHSTTAIRAARNPGAGFVHASEAGYEYFHHTMDDTTVICLAHRLLAVAEFGYEEVIDKVVHHKNHIPWDNRPDNIELMTASEHSSYHNNVESRLYPETPSEQP